jgi:DNA-directed RNA polymerase specialized sigma24 family protein
VDDESAALAEYSAFYLENVPRLVNFLVSQGWLISDAADCVQDTLIDALPPTWATLEDPYAWCRRVSYRKHANRPGGNVRGRSLILSLRVHR